MKVDVPTGVLNTATMIIVREYFGVDTSANDIAPDAYVSCQALATDILAAVIPAIRAAERERCAVALNEMADFEADGRAVIALRGAATVFRALGDE